MGNGINLFDASLGIQNVLNMHSNENLPEARQIASSVIREAGIEDIYNATNMTTLMENLLCPSVGDGEILRADNFSRTLEACADSLKNSNDPQVQTFLQEVLFPLLENEELLHTYCGLMIGG